MKNNDINEKLSALYDGELDESEVNSVLDALSIRRKPPKKIVSLCPNEFSTKY